jgi:hypothetical protein
MNVKVKDGLPGSLTIIDADVETIRIKAPFDLFACDRETVRQCRLLFSSGLKPGRYVATWEHQRMSL